MSLPFFLPLIKSFFVPEIDEKGADERQKLKEARGKQREREGRKLHRKHSQGERIAEIAVQHEGMSRRRFLMMMMNRVKSCSLFPSNLCLAIPSAALFLSLSPSTSPFALTISSCVTLLFSVCSMIFILLSFTRLCVCLCLCRRRLSHRRHTISARTKKSEEMKKS